MTNYSINETAKKELTLQMISMPILVIAAGTAFLYFAGPVLAPIVISVSLAYVLLPIVDAIRRLKVPHTVAVFIVTVVVLGIFTLLSILLAGQVSDLAAAVPGYISKITTKISEWNPRLGETLNYYVGNINHPENLPVDSTRLTSIGKFLLKGATSITNFVVGVVSIIFLVLFMLLESQLFRRKFRVIFGEEYTDAAETVLGEIDQQLRGFIQIRFYILIGLSIVITIGLLILKVPYAYIWGPLAGVLNIIPYIGSIVGSVIPVIVVGLQTGSFFQMLYVAIFFTVVQMVEGNYITPKLTSNSVDLNAVTVLVSLMYWGWLWGGIGLLMAVPITAAIKVVFDHIEPLRPIGTIMGTERKDPVSAAVTGV